MVGARGFGIADRDVAADAQNLRSEDRQKIIQYGRPGKFKKFYANIQPFILRTMMGRPTNYFQRYIIPGETVDDIWDDYTSGPPKEHVEEHVKKIKKREDLVRQNGVLGRRKTFTPAGGYNIAEIIGRLGSARAGSNIQQEGSSVGGGAPSEYSRALASAQADAANASLVNEYLRMLDASYSTANQQAERMRSQTQANIAGQQYPEFAPNPGAVGADWAASTIWNKLFSSV